MKIKTGTDLLGLLEDGQLAKDFKEEIQTAITKTREAVGVRASGSCSVSLTLKMDVDGDGVEFLAEFSSKIPKARREKTFLFLGEEGDVHTESQRPKTEFEEEQRRRGRPDA